MTGLEIALASVVIVYLAARGLFLLMISMGYWD